MSRPVVAVLVVDDQAIFRRALLALVRSTAGFEVAGEATSGEEAVEQARALQPDLVLMDVRLPGIDGVEATRRIVAERPATRVLLVSTLEAGDLPPGARECGARGFVRKQDLDAPALADSIA